MRPMTIEDFLKYVNAEAHYSSGIFCFCEYSVDFITDRDSEDGSFHVHVTFSRYRVESEVDMEIDFVCGKVLLSEGALSEVQTAIRNACAHHRFTLSVKQMKRKRCLVKDCRHFRKKKEHDYWKAKERAKQARKERKNDAT